jgi:hypothetical protein
MSTYLRYDLMVEEALRGVVYTALKQASEQGLQGDHHFYISFRTDEEGVLMPEGLKGNYPEEMTIVLQHQYWDLQIKKDLFEVTLSFNAAQQRLIIPFHAITAFADPAVKFGLQFHTISAARSREESKLEEHAEGKEAKPAKASKAKKGSAKEQAAETGQVISLDSFRKQKKDQDS